MKKFFLALVLTFILFSCNYSGNKKKSLQNDTSYLKEAKSFLNFIRDSVYTESNFILSDKPYDFKSDNGLSYLTLDSFLTTEEKTFVLKSIKDPVITNWNISFLKNITPLNSDTISDVFKNNKKSWRYFYSHYGENFKEFSLPVFLRNYQYCVFYSANNCGSKCGTGQLAIYKKSGNSWIVIKTIYSWIS